EEVLALDGPAAADRRALYDFIVAELRDRAAQGERRLRSLSTFLDNHRDQLLGFAAQLGRDLAELAARFHVPVTTCRALLRLHRPRPAPGPPPPAVGKARPNSASNSTGGSTTSTRPSSTWPSTRSGPVPWSRTSTVGCGTTLPCGATSAPTTWPCSSSSSTTAASTAANVPSAPAKARPNC